MKEFSLYMEESEHVEQYSDEYKARGEHRPYESANCLALLTPSHTRFLRVIGRFSSVPAWRRDYSNCTGVLRSTVLHCTTVHVNLTSRAQRRIKGTSHTS